MRNSNQCLESFHTQDESSDAPVDFRKGVYIQTFGCQMNEYDTRKLYKVLEDQYQPVSAPEDAELILINTCSVRDKPEQKLYSLLGTFRELKQAKPDLLLGVGGCVAQQEGQRIVSRSADVDFVFGTHNLSLVPSLIERRRGGLGPQVAVTYRDEWEELPLGFSEQTTESRASALISISRGCNKNCSYCIVPTTRGPEVSRSPDEILREARIARQRGAKEVILLGQTVNSYGLDLPKRYRFADLLKDISDIDGIERIRFTSPHPQEIREDFIELVRDNPKICRHVHMPLQSGSDKILKLMNRNYRRRRYLGIISELKSAVPEIAITTDIIVGFPGESRSDFDASLEVIKIVEFDNSYSFVFSPRPGTEAASMPELIDSQEKLLRLKELQALQFEITNRRLLEYVGKRVEVMIEGPSAFNPELLQGRISQNITFNFQKPIAGVGVGAIVPALVSAVSRYTLKGEEI